MTKRQLAVVSLMIWKPPLLVLMVVQTSRCDVALLFKVTEGKKKRSWDYEFAKGGEVEKWCYCCCLLLSVVSGQGACWDIDSTVTDVDKSLVRFSRTAAIESRFTHQETPSWPRQQPH